MDNINDGWVVDSTTSFHAKPHSKYFQDYVHGNFGYVYLGDDKACKVVKKGKVLIKLQNGKHVLNHVRHILDFDFIKTIRWWRLHNHTHRKTMEGNQGIFGISQGREYWYILFMYSKCLLQYYFGFYKCRYNFVAS